VEVESGPTEPEVFTVLYINCNNMV
jgi:hypothetical protein